MKLVNQTVKLIPQEKSLNGIYKQIEIAARTCYKSEDKITADSAEEFVEKLIKRNHLAMLEHGTVYMFDDKEENDFWEIANSPYSHVNTDTDGNYLTTNLRVVYELFPNNYKDIIKKFSCDITPEHEIRYTVKCVTSIGIARELCRHRVFSFAQESTRYCNYSKDDDIQFVIPNWAKLNPGKYVRDFIKDDDFDMYWMGDGYLVDCYSDTIENKLLYSYELSEDSYNSLIEKGLKPQDAREILPLGTKTEIVMTGYKSQWTDFFDLRINGTTGKPHPDMKKLATLIKEEIK